MWVYSDFYIFAAALSFRCCNYQNISVFRIRSQIELNNIDSSTSEAPIPRVMKKNEIMHKEISPTRILKNQLAKE